MRTTNKLQRPASPRRRLIPVRITSGEMERLPPIVAIVEMGGTRTVPTSKGRHNVTE